MQDIHFDRICRTSHSESYLISRGEEPFARVELHYTHSYVYGLLVIEREASQAVTTEEVLDLKKLIDRELVETADMPREDFILTVYQGQELGTFVDPESADEAEAGEVDEAFGNADKGPSIVD